MSAIKATFSDFKLIKTRKVAQLVMEVPIEQADAAVKALGGLPTFAEEQWVGIAPLKPEVVQASHRSREDTHQKPRKEALQWDDLPAVKQAAIRCQDEAFQRWICAGVDGPMRADTESVSAAVRRHCRVSSRSEITPDNPEALKIWNQIDAEYRAHAGLR
jgi:hypothetical protein